MPLFLGTYYLGLLTISLVYGVLAVSLDLVWGYTGIPDLGHALWFGIGALSVAMATTKLDSFGIVLTTYPGLGRHLAGLVIGVLVAGAVAAVVGILSFSQREADPFYIAIVTLALTVVAGTIYTPAAPVHGRRQRDLRHRLPRVHQRAVVLRVRGAPRRRRGRRARPRAQRLRPGHALGPRQRAPCALLRRQRRADEAGRVRRRRDDRRGRRRGVRDDRGVRLVAAVRLPLLDADPDLGRRRRPRRRCSARSSAPSA